MPVKNGHQMQKDITTMFAKIAALARKKKADSASRRQKRGDDWYSKLRDTMTPAKIREDKEKLLKERADTSKASARAAHSAQAQKRKDDEKEKAK